MKRILAVGALLFVIVFVALAVSKLTSPVPKPVSMSAPSPAVTGTSVLGVVTKTTDCKTDGTLPDSRCTPGATDPAVTQDNIRTTICVSGYSSKVRPPTSVTDKIKTQEMAAYADTGTKADYELDHLISLELGGCPDCVANLWPEPYSGNLNAHEKDKVENYLHKQVCDGSIPLNVAQSEIAHDWVSVYNTLQQ